MWRNIKALSLIIGTLYWFQIGPVTGSRPQIRFYQNSNCTDGAANENFLDTTDELGTSWVTNTSSFHVFGLWKVNAMTEPDASGARHGFTLIHFVARPPNGLCVDKSEWTNIDYEKYHFQYVERLGPSADMATSGVTFYTETVFGGLRVTVSEDMPKVTPRPFAMLSYIHFSNDTWAVYPEENFGGNPKYILPYMGEGLVKPVDSYSYNSTTKTIVGSIKKVQGDDLSTTTTTTTTATTDSSDAGTFTVVSLIIIGLSIVSFLLA